jgi:hypothetical protein
MTLGFNGVISNLYAYTLRIVGKLLHGYDLLWRNPNLYLRISTREPKMTDHALQS